VNWERKGWPAYRLSLAQYLLFGVPLDEYYCWWQEVYAPCDGIIVQAEDGYKERTRTKLLSDLSNLIKMLIISTQRKMTYNQLLATTSLWNVPTRYMLD